MRDASESARLRQYLLDETYWSLGRMPLFLAPGPRPTCPFAARDPNVALCSFLQEPSGDDERAARIGWLVGYGDLVEGIRVAQGLMRVLRGQGWVKLQTILRAFRDKPALGDLATGILDPARWTPYARLDLWADGWLGLLDLEHAAGLGERAPDATRLDAAFRQLERVVESCRDPVYRTPLGRGLPLNDFCEAPRPAATEGTCSGVPTSVAGWVGHARGAGIVARVVAAPDRAGRLAALCAPEHVTQAFDLLSGSDSRIRDLRGELESLSRVARAFRVEVDEYTIWVERRRRRGPDGTSLRALQLRDLGAAVEHLGTIGAAFDGLAESAHQGDVWALVRLAPRRDTWLRVFDTYGDAATSVGRVLRLLSAVDTDGADDASTRTVGSTIATLQTLGSPVLARLGPVLAFLRTDRQMTIETMLYLLDRMNPEDVVVALGLSDRARAYCAEDETSLACWVHRILLVLGEATDVSGDQVSVDPNRIVKTLGALGEDYRRRNDWRWYFHLTIGLGAMASSLPAAVAESGRRTFRTVPMMAEQIGIGYASPTFADGRFALKLGVFGSGILYRVVLDSEESNAFFFGGFLALELYQLLELFAAPSAAIYPPEDGGRTRASWSVSFGAQVPLGEYLSQR